MLARFRAHASLFFAALLFFYGIAMALSGMTVIPLVRLLEAGLLAITIALLKVIILCPAPVAPRWALILWIILSVVLSLVVVILFGWFVGLPGWVIFLFALYMTLVLLSTQTLVN